MTKELNLMKTRSTLTSHQTHDGVSVLPPDDMIEEEEEEERSLYEGCIKYELKCSSELWVYLNSLEFCLFLLFPDSL